MIGVMMRTVSLSTRIDRLRGDLFAMAARVPYADGEPLLDACVRAYSVALIAASCDALTARREFIWHAATIRGSWRMFGASETDPCIVTLTEFIDEAIRDGVVGPNELSGAGRPEWLSCGS